MIVLSSFGRDIGSDVLDIFLDAFVDDFLSDDSVEQYVELDYDSFQVIFFISIFLGHKEPVFFFENVLYLADYVRSPDYLPVLLRVVGLFVQSFLEPFQKKDSVGFGESA